MAGDLRELIESLGATFPPFGSGVSTEAIAHANHALGATLPPSYQWWLRSYGSGQIGGDILYGIDEERIGLPDIVQLHSLNAADAGDEGQRITFCIGNEETFWFDTRDRLPDGEWAVIYQEHGQEAEEYATSFAEFLRRRLREVLGRGVGEGAARRRTRR